MKFFKKIILTSFLICNFAIADQAVNLSIVHPSRYTDNSTLPISAIQGYKIYYAVDSVATLQSESLSVGVVDSVTLNLNLKPRSTPYSIHVAAQTVTAAGVSDLSSEISISKQITDNVRPLAPIIIDINIQCDLNCKIVGGDGL